MPEMWNPGTVLSYADRTDYDSICHLLDTEKMSYL